MKINHWFSQFSRIFLIQFLCLQLVLVSFIFPTVSSVAAEPLYSDTTSQSDAEAALEQPHRLSAGLGRQSHGMEDSMVSL